VFVQNCSYRHSGTILHSHISFRLTIRAACQARKLALCSIALQNGGIVARKSDPVLRTGKKAKEVALNVGKDAGHSNKDAKVRQCQLRRNC
jgi:hypothetical protein